MPLDNYEFLGIFYTHNFLTLKNCYSMYTDRVQGIGVFTFTAIGHTQCAFVAHNTHTSAYCLEKRGSLCL